MASTAPASDLQSFLEGMAGEVIVGDANAVAVSYQIHTGTTYTLNFWSFSVGGYENAMLAGQDARSVAHMKSFIVLGNPVRLMPNQSTIGMGGQVDPHPEIPQGVFLIWQGSDGRPTYTTEDDGTISVSMSFAVLPPFVNVQNGGSC